MLLQMNKLPEALLAYEAGSETDAKPVGFSVGASKAAKLAGRMSTLTRYFSAIAREEGQFSPRP